MPRPLPLWISGALRLSLPLSLSMPTVASGQDPQEPAWPTTSLYGRVVTVTHRAVPAAKVWVTASTGEIVARTFADGSGYYQMRGLPSGPLRVHASAEGKVDGARAVAAQGLVREATLPLEDGADLELALAFDDGSPVADADVLVTARHALGEPFAFWRDARSDEEGVVRLVDAPLRELRVQVHVPGLALCEATVERDATGQAAIEVPRQQIPSRTVRVSGLPQGAVAELLCVRAAGRNSAVPGLPLGIRRTPIGADGTAQLSGLPLSHEVRVVADGQRSMPVYATRKLGDTRGIEFALSPIPEDLRAPSTMVRGRVVDSLGRPMPGVAVAARCQDRRSDPVRADDQGRFRIDVPARKGVLFELCALSQEHHVATRGFSVDDSGLAWLRCSADRDATVRLDVVRAGAVGGTLRRPDGQPWAAARVHLTAKDAKVAIVSATDAVGRLRVPCIPAAEYALLVFGADGMHATGTVLVAEGAPSEPGPLEFVPMGEVVGRALGADGEPAAGVHVTVAPVVNMLRGRGRRALLGRATPRSVLTDREGRFRIPHVEVGTWWVQATTDRSRPRRFVMGNAPGQFDVEAGEHAEVEVELAR